MKERILTTIIVWFAIALSTYLGVSFSQLGFDFTGWSSGARDTCAVLVFGISSFISLVVYSVFEDTKNRD